MASRMIFCFFAVFCAACSTVKTDVRNNLAIQRDSAELKALEKRFEECRENYVNVLLVTADLLEPSGASPSEIASAALMKCDGDYWSLEQASRNIKGWRLRNTPSIADWLYPEEDPAMWKRIYRDIIFTRVVETRAKLTRGETPK